MEGCEKSSLDRNKSQHSYALINKPRISQNSKCQQELKNDALMDSRGLKSANFTYSWDMETGDKLRPDESLSSYANSYTPPYNSLT